MDNALESQIAIVCDRLNALMHSAADRTLEPADASLVPLLQQLQALLVSQQAEIAALRQQQCEQEYRHTLLLEEYQRYQRVASLTQHLRQSLDSTELLQQTVNAVRQLLQVDRVVIYQFQPDGTAVLAAAAALPGYELSPELLHATVAEPQAAAMQTFCRQIGILIVNSTRPIITNPDIAAFIEQQQAEAVLAAPMRQDDLLLGLVCLHRRSSYVWQSFEVELLQQLTTEVAIALQQLQLYQQAQHLNADLEQQVQQRTSQLETALKFESMLKRITDRVRDSLDEAQIVQAAVRELTLVLELGACNAALYDLNQGTSTIRYEYTRSLPASQGRVAHMEDFPEIYQQLQQGHYFQFCSLLPNPARGKVAMLACPIFVDPRSSQGISQAVLGDLWLIHTKDHIFDEFEIRLVQQVANQCAIAIRQARLYQAAQGQVQELEALNRLKDEFLSTVSHELRTPMTNIKMAIQMLKSAATPEKRNKYLGILEQEAIREADLINDLLDVQQLEAGTRTLELETIFLPDWLPQLIEPFQPRLASNRHAFQLDCPADLRPFVSDPVLLRRILAELLNNACKYTAPGQAIRLSVRQSRQSCPLGEADDRCFNQVTTFRLSNQAHIPAVELPRIFDKFYRCPNADPWKQGGTGLGLALVQKLVERLQGTIEAESAEGWTRFTVQLPLLDISNP